MCVRERECLSVYMLTLSFLLAVNNYACYMWIVNEIIDCNSSLFSVCVF